MTEIIATTLELTYEKIVEDNNELDTSIIWASHQVRSAIHLIGDQTASAIEIFKALSSDLYLLKHSYLVSLFSLTLAKKLNFSNERNLLGVGLGALLHDIGHTRMNFELFQKIHLTPKEWEEVKDHPVLGLKILERSRTITEDVRSIILQHHVPKPARDGACAGALALPKQRTRQRETPRWKARRLGARRTTDAYRSPLRPPSAPRPRPATTFRASRPP